MNVWLRKCSVVGGLRVPESRKREKTRRDVVRALVDQSLKKSGGRPSNRCCNFDSLNTMDDFDDEMLFDSEAWHEVSVPLPADNDNRQWQQGSIDIASRDGKSSRAASPGAQSQPVPMAIESIKKLTYQNGVPDSPKAQNTPKNAQVSSGGKRDR